jgi:hypothetical protein
MASSPVEILVTSIATVAALKAAGQYVPALKPITAGASILMAIDDKMEKAAAESVLEANRNSDGSTPNIICISDFLNGTRNKRSLEGYVEQQGGTAWFQMGSNKRMEAFWHHSRSFKPKQGKDCYLGHIVHGSKDGI